MIGNLKAGMAAVAGLAAGALLTLSGAVLYVWLVTIPAATAAGAAGERAAWTERMAEAEAEAAAKREAAQADIDRIERDYHAKAAARALELTALEHALEEEQARVPKPTPADRGLSCAPGALIPRGVRDALQDLGRSPARAHPAEPDAAVRGGG